MPIPESNGHNLLQGFLDFRIRYKPKSNTGCPKKNDTKNLVFFQKRSDTKWHEIIKTKCPTVWGVDFNKLKATQIPLKKTRAKRAVKNLTARLALVFLPGIIEQSAF